MTSLDVLDKLEMPIVMHMNVTLLSFLVCTPLGIIGILVASSSQKCILGYDRMHYTILSILESRNNARHDSDHPCHKT